MPRDTRMVRGISARPATRQSAGSPGSLHARLPAFPPCGRELPMRIPTSGGRDLLPILIPPGRRPVEPPSPGGMPKRSRALPWPSGPAAPGPPCRSRFRIRPTFPMTDNAPSSVSRRTGMMKSVHFRKNPARPHSTSAGSTRYRRPTSLSASVSASTPGVSITSRRTSSRRADSIPCRRGK